MILLAFSILFLSLISPSFASDSYTPSEETHCINNTCTLTLYSGVRYVFEDSIWKKVENAKSLKSVWNKVYLEKDPDFDIDVVEVNYSYIELNFSFNSSNYAKYPECGASKEDDIKCDFKLTVKEDVWNDTSQEFYKTETKFQYKYQEKDGVKDTLKFIQKGIPLGKKYTFGGNSTTITLNETNGGNIGDSKVSGVGPFPAEQRNNNYGITTPISAYTANPDYIFIKFNLSSIPAGSTITNANFSIYEISSTGTTAHTVYNTSLYNSTGAGPWVEGSLNGVACSGTGCDLTRNITYKNMPSLGTLQDTNNGISSGSAFLYFNVTNATVTAFAQSGVNQTVSLQMRIVNVRSLAPKEYATVSSRPQLVITYTAGAQDYYQNFTDLISFTSIQSKLFDLSRFNSDSFTPSDVNSRLKIISDRLLTDSLSLSSIYSRMIDINRFYIESFLISDIYSRLTAIQNQFSSSLTVESLNLNLIIYERILDDIANISSNILNLLTQTQVPSDGGGGGGSEEIPLNITLKKTNQTCETDDDCFGLDSGDAVCIDGFCHVEVAEVKPKALELMPAALIFLVFLIVIIITERKEQIKEALIENGVIRDKKKRYYKVRAGKKFEIKREEMPAIERENKTIKKLKKGMNDIKERLLG